MKCPFCAEEIQPEAKKCKHCGEWLDAASGRSGSASSEPGTADARAVAKGIKKARQDEQGAGCLGTIALVVSVAIGCLAKSLTGNDIIGLVVGAILFMVAMFKITVLFNRE